MKASSYLTIGLCLLATIAAGCDNISEDDRYIKVEKPTVDNPRNLLIMEFTGNQCTNCPNGAAEVEKIKEKNDPGSVISVGLHPAGSPFTEPVIAYYPYPHRQDFRCELATEWFNYYKPGNAFPTAIFNGVKSSISANVLEWMRISSEALLIPAKMNISVSGQYDEVSREVTLDYEVAFGNVVDTKLNITMWVMENHIIGTQTVNGVKVTDYEHNHVLRGSMNGIWGEYIGDSFDSDSRITGTVSYTLPEEWVAENCDIVVFVFKDDNKEVEQSTSISIKDFSSVED